MGNIYSYIIPQAQEIPITSENETRFYCDCYRCDDMSLPTIWTPRTYLANHGDYYTQYSVPTYLIVKVREDVRANPHANHRLYSPSRT
jgi:hypothetical protein